jgi:hypothetical protein
VKAGMLDAGEWTEEKRSKGVCVERYYVVVLYQSDIQ